MTDGWPMLAGLGLALLAGTGFGALYFALLWRAAQGLGAGRAGAAGIVLGFALRLALAVGVLVLALRLGAGAEHVLAGVLGFVLARQGALRRLGGRD